MHKALGNIGTGPQHRLRANPQSEVKDATMLGYMEKPCRLAGNCNKDGLKDIFCMENMILTK